MTRESKKKFKNYVSAFDLKNKEITALSINSGINAFSKNYSDYPTTFLIFYFLFLIYKSQFN